MRCMQFENERSMLISPMNEFVSVREDGARFLQVRVQLDPKDQRVDEER